MVQFYKISQYCAQIPGRCGEDKYRPIFLSLYASTLHIYVASAVNLFCSFYILFIRKLQTLTYQQFEILTAENKKGTYYWV